jgi:GrpB-like predicted nucleotidyltransferase (UPF0157 family)/ribosomal protein S18 acetylase RimI-like enzyme
MENKASMERKIVVDAPKPEDARDIQEVFYKTWLDTYPNEEAGITVEDIEDKYKDVFTDEAIQTRAEKITHPAEGQTMFVARDGSKVVGFCRVIQEEDRSKLSTIYVLPEYQGKGVGRSLWNDAQNVLDKSKDIFVEVATYNTNSIEFYKKLGFEDTGRRFNDVIPMKSGATIPEMEMVIKRNKNMLVPHSPEWAQKFNRERNLIKSTLGDAVLDIQHIGSTAFPDIVAKPIVDIIAAVSSLDEATSIIPVLEKIGYEYKPDMSSTERLFFRKGDPVEFHLSLAQPDHTPFWERQLLIRDFLLAHPEYAKEYEQIKRDALKNVPEADRGDLSRSKDYNAPKGAFIDKIVALAKAEKKQ